MTTTEATVRTRSIELGGGRVLHVSRFQDPATGRDRLSFVAGWTDSSPLPPRPDGDVVEVSGGKLGEVVEALEALDAE